jgi:general nucleoside transport system permease protein
MILDSFLSAGLALSCPILLAALGELLVERAGVLNIGVEGMMLIGAFAAAVAAVASTSASAGVAAGGAAGAAAGLLFAVVTVGLAADQIIVGAAINLLALGGTGALYRAFYGETGAALLVPTLPRLALPGLSQIPLVGRPLFEQHALVYLGLALVPVLAIGIRRTGLGLRLRALGDHPTAAASLGLPVRLYRTAALVVCGGLAGLAGASLTLWTAGTFVEGVTSGRGFVALAVVVFARWSPWGVLAGSLLFGLVNALQFHFQATASSPALPYQLFLVLPYVVTLAAMLLPAGVDRAPRALGTRYERS